MIYLTGDIHGERSINKLSIHNFIHQKNMTKDDYVIILGDFGLLWHPYGSKNDKQQQYWLNWLEEKPFTTLFVDGNHENHTMLYKLPIVEKFGGKVGMVKDSIFHLKRGEVYEIDGDKFFVMGGGLSVDKYVNPYRIPDIGWWEAEIPSTSEFEYGLVNLKKHNWTVDYILGHTCPTMVGRLYIQEIKNYGDAILKKIDLDANIQLSGDQLAYLSFDDEWCGQKINDSVSTYFSEVVKQTKFKKFYFGHFHSNWCTNGERYIMLYEDVVMLDEIKPQWKNSN